jgi:uncharacterized protein YjiK
MKASGLLIMKKLSSSKYILLCLIMLATLNDSIAGDGNNISKNYHITKPYGQNIDINVQLTEASGLALSGARKSLWTVSDNKKDLVFKMTLKGKPKDSESFEVVNFPYHRPDLEGVCLSDDGQYIYLVQERELAIIKILVTPESINAALLPPAVELSTMKNYSTKVQPYLSEDKNSGLEGITFHSGTKDIFVLIEKVEISGKKGPLLVQVNNDLDTIIETKFLNGDNGFVGVDGDRKIDGSGIDFDRTSKNRFYIVSDEGQRLFLYDWETNTAIPEIDLNYPHAEGVAYDPAKNKLYIVTDGGKKKNSKLYTYTTK